MLQKFEHLSKIIVKLEMLNQMCIIQNFKALFMLSHILSGSLNYVI